MVPKSPNQSFWCSLIALSLKYILCMNRASPILNLFRVDTLSSWTWTSFILPAFYLTLVEIWCIRCIWRWLCVKSSVSAHSDHDVGWLLPSYSNWGWGPNLQFWRHIWKLIGRMETWGNGEQEKTWELEWSPGTVSAAAQVKRSTRRLH